MTGLARLGLTVNAARLSPAFGRRANEEEFLWRAADTTTLLNGTAVLPRLGF
jgi:hypothetical protein